MVQEVAGLVHELVDGGDGDVGDIRDGIPAAFGV